MNYNSAELVRNCILSLKDEACDTITVYDNCSDLRDSVLAHELECLDRRVQVVHGNVNLGFGDGINSAVAHIALADEDLLWTLNPDTEVMPGSAKALLDAIDRGVADIVSPLILDYNGRVWFAGGDIDVLQGRSTHRWVGEPYADVSLESSSMSFMTGAAPMFSGAAWRRLGGYRSDLFMYWEDVDLSLRASAVGITMELEPSAIVKHLEGGSSGVGCGKSELYYYYINRNRFLVCAGYSSRLSLLVGRGCQQSVRMLLGVIARERSGVFGKLISAFRGQFHGYILSGKAA
ncbi:glycosyltransferase family 2 protein [Rhodococcus opacus]|uniref:glycosyltransferase family 2 protein n=1 Tax=Rhodococcus opacus TaxID=37919 RepID=UPI001C4961F7